MMDKDCFNCKHSTPLCYECEEYLCRGKNKEEPQIVRAAEEKSCPSFEKEEDF